MAEMDPQDPRFRARVLVKAIEMSMLIQQCFNPGRTTAMALRVVAKIAETKEEEEITPEMVEQEIDFLIADQAFK